jgi:hypothetical protein
MANFAEIDASNMVTNIIALPDKRVANGVEFISGVLGLEGRWVRYLDNNPACIGGYLLTDTQVFTPHKPYGSWILNSDNFWQAPSPMPSSNNEHIWNELTLSWVEIITEEITGE